MKPSCDGCRLVVPAFEGDGKSTVPYGWKLLPPSEDGKIPVRWYCPTCAVDMKKRPV